MKKIGHKIFNFWWVKNKVISFILDYKYTGSFLGSVISSKFSHEGANPVSGIDYSLLPIIFKSLNRSVSNVYVDVGCGKGRVIAWWLSQGIKNKIYGIELDPEIGKATGARFARNKNVHILIGDASQNIPTDANIFFLFNPFNAEVMERFSQRICGMFNGQNNTKVFYYNPQQLHVFKNHPRWHVECFDVVNCKELKAAAKYFADPIRFAVLRLKEG